MEYKNQIEERTRKAILELRKTKLISGHPFMINTEEHPVGQCWLEYPDGYIHLVTLSKCKTDFEIIRVLSIEESNSLRKSLGI